MTAIQKREVGYFGLVVWMSVVGGFDFGVVAEESCSWFQMGIW